MLKENRSSPLPVTDGRIIRKHCWSFYWLRTSKMSRIDEGRSGYEAAAVQRNDKLCFYNDPCSAPAPAPTYHQIYSPDHTSSSFPSSSSTPARSPSPLQNAVEPAGKSAPLRLKRHCWPPLWADSKFLCSQGTTCGPGGQRRPPSHRTTSPR